jgi:hypothetical protein
LSFRFKGVISKSFCSWLAIISVSIFSIGLVPVKALPPKGVQCHLSVLNQTEEGLSSETLTPFCFLSFIVANIPSFNVAQIVSFVLSLLRIGN